jgi:predicted nucleic acid-binding protein
MIVVDIPIISSMIFPTRYSATVTALHEKNSLWEVPALWKSEFMNVLSLYYRKGLIGYDEGVSALDFAERLIGSREHKVPSRAILARLITTSCSSQDCEFVVLAEKLGTRLVTYNQKIIEQFPAVAVNPEAYLAQ